MSSTTAAERRPAGEPGGAVDGTQETDAHHVTADYTAEQSAALRVARYLAEHGVPIFHAPRDDSQPLGFRLPPRWEFTPPDPAVVDRWRPGDALCAVQGAICDTIDVDPRNGGREQADGLQSAGMWPTTYGRQRTPSGGWHDIIARLKTGSRDAVRPGVDVKGGRSGRISDAGRGMIFIAPTQRPSKADGALRPYVWETEPNLDGIDDDDSGVAFAEIVRTAMAETAKPATDGGESADAELGEFFGPDHKFTRAQARKYCAPVLQALVNAKRGEVNARLNDASMMLGHFTGDFLGEKQAAAWLLDKQKKPWHDDDDRAGKKTIREGLKAGAADWKAIRIEETEAAESEIISAIHEKHRGDLRFAERLTIREASSLRYVHRLGWHAWDGARWKADEDGAAVRAVVAELKRAHSELAALRILAADDPLWIPIVVEFSADIDALEKNVARIKGVLSLAENLRPLSCSPGQLDSDPYLFNTADGTLDLRTGSLRPHDPADLISKVAPGFSEEIGPEWSKFIERVLPDAEIRSFVQRVFGYAMFGKVTEHVLPIFTGTGANGKGTLRDGIRAAFGEYAIEIDASVLMESQHDRHPTELMDLRGARLVFSSETDQGRKFAEAKMKKLVGGDSIRAHLMRENNVEFAPTHLLVMLTNHLPRVSGDDEAVWRRLLKVPFDVVIPEAERDGELPDRLRAEASSILGWCLAGWREYQKLGGLAKPEAVRKATDEYQSSNDVVGRFIEERTESSDAGRTPARELYSAFTAWCGRSGERADSEVEFSAAMGRHGYESRKTGGLKVYRGITLRPEGADDVQPEKGWNDVPLI